MGSDWLREELWGFARTVGGAIISTIQDKKFSNQATGVHRLALVHVLDPNNGGRFYLTSGHIRVGKLSTG